MLSKGLVIRQYIFQLPCISSVHARPCRRLSLTVALSQIVRIYPAIISPECQISTISCFKLKIVPQLKFTPERSDEFIRVVYISRQLQLCQRIGYFVIRITNNGIYISIFIFYCCRIFFQYSFRIFSIHRECRSNHQRTTQRTTFFIVCINSYRFNTSITDIGSNFK